MFEESARMQRQLDDMMDRRLGDGLKIERSEQRSGVSYSYYQSVTINDGYPWVVQQTPGGLSGAVGSVVFTALLILSAIYAFFSALFYRWV